MGQTSSTYTVPGGSIYSEIRHFVKGYLSAGAPVIDVIVNLISDAIYANVRRHYQSFYGPTGSPFGLFTIKQGSVYGTSNNITVQGGDGTVIDGVVTGDSTDGVISEGPARFFLGGHMLLLPEDREWKDNSVSLPAIHSYSTNIVGDTLIDTSAFFGVEGDTLVGRICYPDISLINDDTDAAPLGFPILAVSDRNTIQLDVSDPRNADGSAASLSPTFTTLSEYDVESGKQYRIALSTPGSTRTDSVILDCYEDEVDSTEDPVLARVVEGTVTNGGNAKKVAWRVEVLENINLATNVTYPYATTPPFYYSRRTDNDGNTHHRCVIATLARTASATITDGIITTYNSNDQYNMSLALLPPNTTAAISQTLASGTWATYGSTSAPGMFNGETAKLDRLLFQSLGNVATELNTALQNSGVYSYASGLARVTPGIGTGSTGHIALLSNEEEGALRASYPGTSASPQVSALTTTNPVISVSGHNTLGNSALSNVAKHTSASGTVGLYTTHAKHSGGAAYTLGKAITLSDTPVFTIGSAGQLLAVGVGYYMSADTSSSITSLTVPVINVNLGGLNKAGIQALYHVVPNVFLVGHSSFNFTSAMEMELLTSITWDVGNDNSSVSRILITFGTDFAHSRPNFGVSATLIAK